MRRAREWTAALTRWCEGQPDVLAFTGRCLVHRAEIMQLNGDWPDALEEAQRARQRFIETEERRSRRPGVVPGSRAAAAPRGVRGCGGCLSRGEPVRLGASAGPCPATARTGESRRRPVGDPARARRDDGAAQAGGTAPGVRRDHARRRRRSRLPVAPPSSSSSLPTDTRARCSTAWSRTLAEPCCSPKATPPLRWLRFAALLDVWRELEAPYEVARTRELVGLACRALGDDDAATLELDAARAGFEQLRAAPDAAAPRRMPTHRSVVRARTDPARARGAPTRRGGEIEHADRSRARHQRAHGRPARAEHLRQARRVLAHGCRFVRVRAPARLTGRSGQK